jgi:hypothetical protein
MITDEQVRIALAVWFQDEGCTPGPATLRDMRAALEAALGASTPAADANGWAAYSMTLEHPVYGTFWVYPGRGPGHIYAARCYLPKGASEATSETIGANFATLEAAQAAVTARILELDAEAFPLREVAQ